MKILPVEIHDCLDCPWARVFPTGKSCSHPAWDHENRPAGSFNQTLSSSPCTPEPWDYRCPLPDLGEIPDGRTMQRVDQLSEDQKREFFEKTFPGEALAESVASKIDLDTLTDKVIGKFGGIIASSKFDGLRAWLTKEIESIPPAGSSGMFSVSDDARREALQEALDLLDEVSSPEGPEGDEMAEPDHGSFPCDDDIPF